MAERGIGPRTDTDFARGGIIISGFDIEGGSVSALPPRGDGAHAMVVRCLEATQLARQIFGTPDLEEGGQLRFATRLEFAGGDPEEREGYVFGPTPITRLLTVVRQPGERHPWVCYSRFLGAAARTGSSRVLVSDQIRRPDNEREDYLSTVRIPLRDNELLFRGAEERLDPANIVKLLQARVADLERRENERAAIEGRPGPLRRFGRFILGR